jgi:cobalt-zinc-cadmium efflux system membrane fusion protein
MLPPRTTNREALAATIFALIAVCAATAGCKQKEAAPALTHQRRPDRSIVLSGASAAYVRTEPASPALHEQSHSLVARVSYDERHLARIGPPVQGRVASINVVTGDQVKPGAVLLVLTAPEIAGAQAQVAQARTARALAERVAARAAMLVRDGAGTEAERQQADAALVQAKNEEQRAVAALSAIGGAHGESGFQLRSPIAGTVVERNVSVGTQVHADQDQPLLTVADLSTVWVVADVYEQDLSRIHVGDDAVVKVVAYPDRTFTGKITYVGDTVDPQTRAARARVELTNQDLILRPGMFASVEVKGLGQGAAEVPTSALLARRDQFFVFVTNSDGAYVQREVQIGEQHGQHTTILSGVKPGEQVVTEGAILLDAEANEAL